MTSRYDSRRYEPSKNKTPAIRESDLIASLCLESFEDFVKEFWEEVPGAEPLIWNWHMSVLCQELQNMAERVFVGLPKEHDCVFNISPGTSKSTLCSILFPAWCWARMPRIRILTASHADDLVLDLANKARHVIKGEKYQTCFPSVKISDEQDTKGYYANTQGGDRKTCTVGGKSPMGFHAHIIIIDDPIDPKKAVSELELRTASEFMTGIIPSRKIDKEVTVTFLVMQRLHRNDPTGVMLEKSKIENAPKVKQVCLPASTEFPILPDELKERYTNGLMDPVRLSDKALKEQRALLGEYSFSAQFGQAPRAANAGMFEEHYFNNRVKAAPYDCKRIRYWDRACLVAGTQIVVVVDGKLGHKKIEDVQVGDLVLIRGTKETPVIVRPVLWAGKTKDASGIVTMWTATGQIVSGTPEHRVWTNNRGWVELQYLVKGDQLICCDESASFNPEIDTNPWTTVEGTILRRWEDPMPVYDISVEGDHEFFANGILVHNSTSDGGCLTAGVLLAKDREGHFYVEHVITGQWATKERNERMRAIALRDRARYGPHCEPIIYTEREGGSSGRDAWREVARALAGFVVREDRVTGDKVTRAEPWSSQLASGNVFLVEDGTWDLNAYIQEHCLFPDSTFKDRVDSSSGAFNLLVGWKRLATLHTLPIRRKDKKPTLKVIVCSINHLPSLELKGKELLITVRNPGEDKTFLQEDIKEKLLGTLDLIFADMNPADYQQEWEKEVPTYGQKPETLIMGRDHGKKLWGFILKKRDRPVEEIILLEDKGKRAISLAYGICDVLKVPRDQVECCGDIENNEKEDTNPHIYALCKSTRGMVL